MRCLLGTLVAATLGTFSGELAAQSTVRTWAIEAEVVELNDPDSIFTDVLVGDPVRGFISYDLATPADITSPNDAAYDHAPPFQVAGMVVENQRGGSDIEFVADETDTSFVLVANDFEDEFGEVDALTAVQVVLPPAGFTGAVPVVVVDLASPEFLSDTTLPETLDLRDWPLPTISFYDLFDDVFDLGGGFVDARIVSLTPIGGPVVPGDMDGDGDVDFDDIDIFVMALNDPSDYEDTYGVPPEVRGDLDGDGDNDFDDIDGFVDILTTPDPVAARTVPEPGTAVLLVVGGLVLCGWRRREKSGDRASPKVELEPVRHSCC